MFTRREFARRFLSALTGAAVLQPTKAAPLENSTTKFDVTTEYDFASRWSARAEFASKYYKGRGRIYVTYPALRGIEDFVNRYIEEFQDVPRGWHVAIRRWGVSEMKFNVVFPTDLPYEGAMEEEDVWRLHTHLALEDWILAYPDKRPPPATAVAAWFACIPFHDIGIKRAFGYGFNFILVVRIIDAAAGCLCR